MSFLSWKPIALTILVLLGAIAYNSTVPQSNQVPRHPKFAPLRVPADPKYYDVRISIVYEPIHLFDARERF